MRAFLLLPCALVCSCVGGQTTASPDEPPESSFDSLQPLRAEASPSSPRIEDLPPLPLVACSTAGVEIHPETAQRMSEVASISIDVALDPGCRAGTVSIELVSPRGSTFEIRSKSLNGGNSAHFTIPVAGAAIEQRGLAGAWQVRTLVDGKSMALSGFELTR